MYDVNECFMNIVYKYDLTEEFRQFFESMESTVFYSIMTGGSELEIMNVIGLIISPLTLRIMNVEGVEVVEIMTPEMLELFKAASRLWISG